MKDDIKNHQSENQDLIKETAELEEKYEHLKKECEEKMELMENQIN